MLIETRCLRAKDVSPEIIQKLTAANGKVVTYQGRRALLTFNTSQSLQDGSHNDVLLQFDAIGYAKDAIGDFSILSQIDFRPV